MKEKGKKELEKALKKAHEEGYMDGVIDGYSEGMREFGVYTACSICRKIMIVKNPGARRALGRFFRKQGGGHDVCMKGVKKRKEEEKGKGYV